MDSHFVPLGIHYSHLWQTGQPCGQLRSPLSNRSRSTIRCWNYSSARGHGSAVAPVRLALDEGAELPLVHVVDEHLARQVEAITNSRTLLASLEHHGKDILKNARALAARHGAKAEAILRKTEGGRVRDVIVVEAHEWRADLIVMGTHGHRGIGHIVLGSDADAAVRTAAIPVLLVRSATKK